jgi:hypothetical protein
MDRGAFGPEGGALGLGAIAARLCGRATTGAADAVDAGTASAAPD